MISAADFSVIQVKKIFSGRAVQLEKLKLRAPDGSTFNRELIRHGGSSVIVPVLKKDVFVLVYQHRVAVDGCLLEFPAGTLEPGEKPRHCARRETIEETGYRPRKLVRMGTFYPVPGISTEKMHLFIATGLSPAKGRLDDDEWLERKIMTRRQLEQKILRGTIQDAKTVLGFYYYLQYIKKKS